MKSRITIIIDNDVAKKLRTMQAKKIQKESKNVSFSRVINEILRESL